MHHPDSADIQSCAWRTFSLRPLPVSAETCIFARVRGEAKSATLARGQKSVIQNVSLCAQSSHQKTRAQTLTRLFECLADVIRSERTRRKKKRKKKTNQTGRLRDKVSGSTRLVSRHSQSEHENWIPNTFFLSGSQDPAVQPAVRSDNYSDGLDPFDLPRLLHNSAFHLSRL